jgi:hypothetical protein
VEALEWSHPVPAKPIAVREQERVQVAEHELERLDPVDPQIGCTRSSPMPTSCTGQYASFSNVTGVPILSSALALGRPFTVKLREAITLPSGTVLGRSSPMLGRIVRHAACVASFAD